MPALMMAAYVAVFSAELAGDRTFFALGSLPARFRPWAVLAVYLVLASLAVLPAGE